MMAYYSVLFKIMEKQTISFRLEADKVTALDELATFLDRDRTYLLAEAVQAYLDVQRWHFEQIQAGIDEADAGKVIDHRKVKAMASRWRRRK
jgi:predicted transcriptional regulator